MVGKTLHIDLTAGEAKALEELAKAKEMSEAAVIRQALRLYQLQNSKIAEELPPMPPKGCGWPGMD